ncbi:metalloprotease [Coprinopsis cinerea okayama7|uniref:Metalloprotease n=1 Tax=Coprinopsis cinerea (strain Okayama-7 / 130 / ATCC MYA-4618 / FGSC 9003) TaxID=240176 RepID=A8N056_COPC7|nr:metalloprotease [Coprinopsis cinerea okayama7\|eukprot:XP_001828244.1 metalloprotease [Coprinopsis cinerea okayama7\
MYLLALLFSIVHATTAAAALVRCGSHLSTDEVLAAEAHFEAHKVRALADHQAGFTSYNVEVHFHVINSGESPAEGNVPYDNYNHLKLPSTTPDHDTFARDAQIEDQIAVLNEGFADTGLTFTLVNTTRTLNLHWFANANARNSVDAEMKRALRVGGPETLNIFTVGFTSEDNAGTIGYGTYPTGYANNPSVDGIVLLFSSLPGGTAAPYDEGKTAIHEVGHWVGLYHTFQNACRPIGDFVDDTPSEAWEATGCPIGRDSCPEDPGLDPIHNYMDYTDDACVTHFTPGQVERLRMQLATYRGITL